MAQKKAVAEFSVTVLVCEHCHISGLFQMNLISFLPGFCESNGEGSCSDSSLHQKIHYDEGEHTSCFTEGISYSKTLNRINFLKCLVSTSS